MNKEYTSLGLMSGTSGDGVDASIIKSDGLSKYEVILNKYYEYDKEIYQNIHLLKEKMFHVKLINEILKKKEIDIVGFHGQTILHNSEQRISRQLGDGILLSQLIKKNIVYDFRQNDIKNGGEGAPLTPIFHQLILKQNKIEVPSCVLNIGGISNITIVGNYYPFDFTSRDIGPGNCLIDSWVRKNSNQKFD